MDLVVNGAEQSLDLDPRTTLLDAQREHLGLTGAKKGCDHGQCGACTVLLDGRRVNSCLILAITLSGSEVTTIEGVDHPVQEKFLEHDGFQCGYCTPGQICSAVGMLDEVSKGWPSAVGDPDLTDAEIRERMSGNLCRCGAYPNMVPAIREAAER
jgi:xanthine dehydrogenase YagT iron-sulfur-binding subunit